MLNEQLTRMALFSHIDQPGFSWRTRGHGAISVLDLVARGHQIKRYDPVRLIRGRKVNLCRIGLCRFYKTTYLSL